MKSPAQLAESIARFRGAFWEKRATPRPPVCVVHPDLFLPIKYVRERATGSASLSDEGHWQSQCHPTLRPEDFEPGEVQTDYDFAAARRKVTCDDWMPFAAPWRAIPWIEAACGCPVRSAAGSLAPGCIASLERLAEIPIPADPRWLALMHRETARLAAEAPADCWVSPTILRGPSDVLAAIRGLDNLLCDLHDDLGRIAAAAARVNDLLLETLDRHFALVAPKLGGYGHIYGYWAPGPTIAIQEDALGLCSPAVYREHFLLLNARLVERLGSHALFHLHSTGCRHWRDVLSIPGVAGVQLTVEANGPSINDLVPMLREMLERSRLLLFVDHGFGELAEVLPRLPTEGLCLLLREDHITSDDDFRRFVSSAWR